MNRIARRAKKVAQKICKHKAMIFRKINVREKFELKEKYILIDTCKAHFYTDTNKAEKMGTLNGKQDFSPSYKALLLSVDVEADDQIIPVIDDVVGGSGKRKLIFKVTNEPRNPSFQNAFLVPPLELMTVTYKIVENSEQTILEMK